MKTKESIFQHLKEIIVELSDVDAEVITAESRLYEDLDIDSIDAVDMIVKLKKLTNKRIEPATFKKVRTVQDVVDAVYALMATNADSIAEVGE
ncbi:MAG: acyl carrier protein [Pseudomonadales bacterium]